MITLAGIVILALGIWGDSRHPYDERRPLKSHEPWGTFIFLGSLFIIIGLIK